MKKVLTGVSTVAVMIASISGVQASMSHDDPRMVAHRAMMNQRAIASRQAPAVAAPAVTPTPAVRPAVLQATSSTAPRAVVQATPVARPVAQATSSTTSRPVVQSAPTPVVTSIQGQNLRNLNLAGVTDVHAFNAQMAGRARQAMAVGEAQGLNKNVSFIYVQTYLAALMAADQQMPQALKNEATRGLTALGAHIARSPIDPETGVNVEHMMSMVWSYISPRLAEMEYSDIASIITLLNATLGENLNTGGGCYGGFSGRLGANLMHMINNA